MRGAIGPGLCIGQRLFDFEHLRGSKPAGRLPVGLCICQRLFDFEDLCGSKPAGRLRVRLCVGQMLFDFEDLCGSKPAGRLRVRGAIGPGLCTGQRLFDFEHLCGSLDPGRTTACTRRNPPAIVCWSTIVRFDCSAGRLRVRGVEGSRGPPGAMPRAGAGGDGAASAGGLHGAQTLNPGALLPGFEVWVLGFCFGF